MQLHQLGITEWQLIHPERLQGYQVPHYDLEDDICLLFVAESRPTGKDAAIFEKVLASFNVTLEQSRFATPDSLSLLGNHNLTWVWFSGCEVIDGIAPQVLTSPTLSELDANVEHKRALWQLIRSYQ